MSDNIQQKTFPVWSGHSERHSRLKPLHISWGLFWLENFSPLIMVIAMTQVFFAVCAYIIDSGFSTALIRERIVLR